MVSIDKRIEKWKSMLLDLGRRNKLIDFKETKRSTLKIFKPEANDIFNLLIDDHVLEFVYRNTSKERVGFEEQNDKPILAVDIKLKHNQLLTNRDDDDLYHTLNNIRKKHKTALEEQGINVLYVAFGMLEWKDTFQTKQVFHSPLLMVPVSLVQPGPTDYFQLTISDEEILVNPSLIFKIEKDTKIKFPTFDIENLESLTEFFDEFRQFASKHEWTLIEDVYLGLFSFIKINMYKDLEVHHTQVADHFFVKSLCGESGLIPKIPMDLENFDHDSVSPNDTFQVIDADSSQLDAINAIAHGHSIVLHGPPGTGKSQTITNIIADCLARNRKVLFVSEKMAALDVVYRRLIDTGLSDYCLRLHSLKTNKRDVLDDLSTTLSKGKINLPSNLEGELNKLERNRNKLNSYVKALHTKCSQLHKSIFSIHGELLRYRDFPDVQIQINDVGKINIDNLQTFEEVINEYVATTLKSKDLLEMNPWFGCVLKKNSLTLQQDIKIIYSRYINGLNEILTAFVSFSRKFNLNITLTMEQYDFLIILLDIASRSSNPLYQWFQERDFEKIEKQINTHKKLFTRFITLTNEFRDIYKEDFFLLNANKMISGINEKSEKLATLLNNNEDIEDFVFKESTLFSKLVNLSEKYYSYCDLYQKIQSKIRICNDSSIKSTQETDYVLDYILEKPYATQDWFDLDKSLYIDKIYYNSKKCHEILHGKITIIDDFDEEIFDLEINDLIVKFRTDYCTILKYFKSAYHKDKKLLGSFKKNRQLKMNDNDWLSLLDKIKTIQLSKTWLLENQTTLHYTLGKQYKGELTDWDSLHNSILSVTKLVNYLNGQISSSFQNILINPDQYKDMIENEVIPFKQIHKERIHSQITSFLPSDNEDIEITKEQIKQINSHLSILRSLYGKVFHLMKIPENKQIIQIIDDLMNLTTWQKLNTKISNSKDEFKSLYEEYFLDLETNWDELLERIGWCKEMSVFLGPLLEEYLPFIEILCKVKDSHSDCLLFLNHLKTWNISSCEDLDYIKKQFDHSVRNFDSIFFSELSKWLQECINNIFSLEVWIDYHNALEKCYKLGLKDFIDIAIRNKIPPEEILGSYYKRFYRLWLDEMYTRFPDVENFRSNNHENMIKIFKEEDKNLFVSAKLRINQICRNLKPEMNSFTMNTGEMGILSKELNKKKRIKPLRILFREIPELLMSIKPCLMMSPLSVSLLLDPTRYHFDVVIFDEASQIFTEDAIGAIYRGKQLVVAGDNQQLPPTTFFMASTSDGDEEYDEENDDDADSYESVLDEARTIMPEKKLLWHYRSRHEHLIAFSNNQIYNNSLITFPSLYERAKNLGVEYYYLPEGVYDRGKKRNNIEEAKKVVDLI